MSTVKSESWEWLKAVLIALLLAFMIRYFLFAPIVVDGESMMPTLQNSDRLIVNKIGYTISKPERFDIIVFHATSEKDYIKRVIGLPGDSIAYENDELYLNGQLVEELYLAEYQTEYQKDAYSLPFTGDFTLEDFTGIDVVPEGHLFVLGDNRQHSKDSRHIGFISYDSVVGSANVIFWPFSEIRIAK
ncbi:signal peptidase I [Bacillaceae bacterium IKA-2]|nr:signal peptidase I [Bacillaceae bacterium IKA-2]